jgi:tetratricopeptide (TPR) repeat protein
VRGAVADGEKAYREQRYTGAIRAYEAAAGTLDAIEKDIPTVVADALDEGERGLLSSDPRAAEQAYALAASLDPGNAAAQRGLARAAAFDRVVALLAEARGYERMHDDERAATAYRAALALDADATEATQALQRIANARADVAYEAQMSKGYGALDNGDFVAARTAFEAAQKLRPHAKETINALAQTAARETAARIEHALAEAQRAEQAERWDEAGAKYRAALALDKGLETANAGAQRAAARAALVKRLATAIADPERLMDAGVYQDAEQLLAEARSIPAPGPRLAAQVNELHKRLVDARTSIPVTLVSDGATDVTIVRVGHLGSFTERALSLYPGRYTALGRRGGYRDARVEFTLAADTGAPPPITIQCQEQLPFGR